MSDAIPLPRIRPYIRHAGPGQPMELMTAGGHAAESLDDADAAALLGELAAGLRSNGHNVYAVETARPMRALETPGKKD